MNSRGSLPKSSLAFYNKALDFQNKGRFSEAIAIYKNLNIKHPKQYLIEINLGACYFTSKEFLKAAKIFQLLHERFTDDLLIVKNCAITYINLGQYEIAIRFLQRLVAKNSEDIETWMNLTFCSARLQKYEDSIYYATQALSLDPKNPQAFNNMGSALIALHRYQDSLICFKTSLELEPNNAIAISNIATLADKIGDFEESIEYFKLALKLVDNGSQEENDYQYRMSFPLLATGKLELGWKYYENGFSVKNLGRSPNRKFSKPKWNGENINGKKLLVWREQGIGDEVWFLSLLDKILPLCDSIIIECSARLITLIQRSFPMCEVREEQFDHNSLISTYEDFDFQIPIGSLSQLFMTEVDNIKSAKKYLKASPDLIERFKKRLTPYNQKYLMGISWRSGNLNNDRNINYIPISEFESILKISEIQFINLQYGDCSEEIENVKNHFNIDILNWDDLDLKNDLESVAALISNLDAIIAPTTFVADFGPALGISTKIFGYKHWGMLGKKNWPWSENVVFYSPESRNQPLNSVLKALETDLIDLTKKRPTL